MRITGAAPFLAVALVAACTKKEAAAPAPAPAEPAKAAPAAPAAAPKAPDKLYVTASTLRLRRGPSPKARTRGRLAINSPLTPLETKGDFTKVRVENGRTGWVGSAFLAPKPITKDAALSAAEAAEDSKDRLSWLQRAAAVAAKDTTVLQRLRAAYEADGNTKGAESVGRLIDRLEQRIKPNRHIEDKPARIEWQMIEPDRERPHGPVAKAEWPSFGLDAEATYWVLPSFGPAVKGRVTKAAIDTVNECGGTSALVVTVETDTDLGEALAVAVAVGERPKGWDEDAPPPEYDQRILGQAEETAKALVNKRRKPFLAKDQKRATKAPNDEEAEFYRSEGLEARLGVQEMFVLGDDQSVEVVVAEAIAADYDAILQPYRVWTVIVDAQGKPTLKGKPERIDGFLPRPMARRDIDGDGSPDTVVDNGCSTSIRSVDGEILYDTGFTCCGC